MPNEKLIEALTSIAKIKDIKEGKKGSFPAKAYLNAAKFISGFSNPIILSDIVGQQGFGEKITESVKQFLMTGEIDWLKKNKNLLPKEEKEIRFPRKKALEIAEEVLTCLKPYIRKYELMGSIRRMKETVGDLDIAVEPTNCEKLMEVFCSIPNIDVEMNGTKKSVIFLKTYGISVDLYVFAPNEWGPAQQFLTGNSYHNKKIRLLAIKKGLLLNQYGLWDRAKTKRFDDGSEASIYNILGFKWIPPEERNGDKEFIIYKI